MKKTFYPIFILQKKLALFYILGFILVFINRSVKNIFGFSPVVQKIIPKNSKLYKLESNQLGEMLGVFEDFSIRFFGITIVFL